jgi:PBSX family phage terminase large subunit
MLKRVYRPRGTALELFSRREPEVLISGPAGTGKSRACLEKVHAMALQKPSRHLIVRKTLASLGATGLETWRSFVVPEAMELGVVDFYGGSAQQPPQYRYRNGSVVLIGGLDKPSKIMSLEVDSAYVQEATELNLTDWEMLSTRLRNGSLSFQQLLADCNPAAPTHWLKLRADAGAVTMLNAAHTDNPVLYDDNGELTEKGRNYIGRLDALTGVQYQRLRKGMWVAAEGLIYEDYDPATQLTYKPKEPPDSWERYWTVDFGFTNPFVLQCWAIDTDGRAHLYREIYKTKTLVEDHAKRILSLVTRADGTWKEPKPRAIICDHDAEDRATLEKHLGLPTVAAKKTVSDGLQATQARFKKAGDGQPRIFFVRDALEQRDQSLAEAGRPTCTADEVGGYIWNSDKDAPVKENDHGMDAMRYLVAHLDLQAQPRMRWL